MQLGERYEIEGKLGAGGFGTTYVALDRDSGRRVAIKVLDLRRVSDWKAVELFEREAKVLQSLSHPGIPAYVEFRPLQAEREAYLVQGLAPGKTLLAWLAERRFSEAELVDLTQRVLQILQYLTSRHPVVIHRDIKPANILLADDDTVSLVDFGAVRDIVDPEGGSTVAGTFGYMAPEQLQGHAVPSSDLYGLGMALVHLATGIEPSELPTKRLKPDFRPHVHMSDAFEAFVDRLIEPVPDDRFPTATEALAALQALHGPEPALSSDAIAQRRVQAERAQAERAKMRRKRDRAPASPRLDGDRVTVHEDDEGVTIAIAPAPVWRGREIHFGLLIVVGPMLLGGVGAAVAGTVGVIVGLLATVALGALSWFTAPTWRVRITGGGDFILYARNPERPKWIGTRRSLRVETVSTQRGDTIAYLHFTGSGAPATMPLYPLGPGDPAKLRVLGAGPR